MLHADPELTRRIRDDVRELERAEEEHGLDYEALAHVAHDQMIDVLRRVVEDHQDLAGDVIRWDEEPPISQRGYPDA